MHRKVSETLVKRPTKEILGGGAVEGRRHVEEIMGSHHNPQTLDTSVRVFSSFPDPYWEVGQSKPTELF